MATVRIYKSLPDDTASSTETVTVVGGWVSGAHIVIVGKMESGAETFNDPTSTNLSGFTRRTPEAGSSGSTARSTMWTVVSGSAQGTDQTVTLTRTGAATFHSYCEVWVIEPTGGDVLGFANYTPLGTNAAWTFTPTAGSVVIYSDNDFNAVAARTGTTGTGTATVGLSQQVAGTYTVFSTAWNGVTATSTAFGTTSYTGALVQAVGIEVTTVAAAVNPFQYPVLREGSSALIPDEIWAVGGLYAVAAVGRVLVS